MAVAHSMYSLKGVVQHYSWGGTEFIPALLQVENKEQQPFAEYWLGAHPNHPSQLTNINTSLASLITQHPQVIGKGVQQKFSSLPYLLKVLDVRQMLSIQVHPSKTEAQKNFLLENVKGIEVHAPHRNYKDDNHKPELMVALGDFWLLHGFKNEVNMGIMFNATTELSALRKLYEEQGLKALYEEAMQMPQQQVNEILQPLMNRILPLYEKDILEKKEEDFWAARAAKHFCKDGNYDRGIFSIYFFNLVNLKKGEGIFQPEGMPHAYLEGKNIEVMANSDNVLRAGLTDKHVDVEELMKHVKFQSTSPAILTPAGSQHKVFESPAEEFELHQYLLDEGEAVNVLTEAGEIFFVLSGSAAATNHGEQLLLKTGGAFFAVEGKAVNIQAHSSLCLFRVTVPAVKKLV